MDLPLTQADVDSFDPNAFRFEWPPAFQKLSGEHLEFFLSGITPEEYAILDGNDSDPNWVDGDDPDFAKNHANFPVFPPHWRIE
jgi:hypothetical protein